ncbi:MAG: protein-glutamate O-methyltransferase [Pseudomonadota bacterium]
MSLDLDRQAELTQGAYERLAVLARDKWGLVLAPHKRRMVASRLRHRLGALDLPDFESYCTLIESAAGQSEWQHTVSALTTNVSNFFREPHHFTLLTERVVPRARAILDAGGRVRLWSAGCSNGQEAYSIVMTMLRADPSLGKSDFRVLATDIDPKVITFAKAGHYAPGMLKGTPPAVLERFTEAGPGGTLSISPRVREMVRFRTLNLLDPWPMRGQFDVIFCRNVVIYFDQATQMRLWPRFAAALTEDGLLCVGHSERVTGPGSNMLTALGPTTYQRVGPRSGHAG